MTLSPTCFGTPSDRQANLSKALKAPMEMKVHYSIAKIREFYIEQKGQVYVSYSGGKDSTVLLHLVRSVYPDVPAVFVDTGLEFPEIREHVKATDNVVWVKPEMSFKKVIETYGYPCIGKVCAHWIRLARNGAPSGIEHMNRPSDRQYGYLPYKFMVDAPFNVSEQCCDIMKKRPAKSYNKETGRSPYIGTRLDESAVRESSWIEEGENRTTASGPTSNPISIWTEADIWEYLRTRQVPYSTIYDKGYDRTGCMFCMFGIMQDRDRFLKLKATHPQIWAYCMRERDTGGLGMREVLDYMGIPTGCNQACLEDFA